MTNATKTKMVTNPFGATKPKDDMSIIKSHVDRLFQDAPAMRGQLCENPVTGGYYVAGEDPIAPQKRRCVAHCSPANGLHIYGPQDAQPLPISDEEIEDRKYAWDSEHLAQLHRLVLRLLSPIS